MEYFDIVDENGEPTGETVERETAHREGILHRTSHLWLVRKKDGVVQVLLQKRSENKDSHPGCYDRSSAGHIPAGMGYEESAIRELYEELGVEAKKEELHYCGTRRIEFVETFHEKPFHDNQVTKVYMMWKDVEVSDLKLQEEEVSDALWMDLDECIEKMTTNAIPHSVHPEELTMLKQYLAQE